MKVKFKKFHENAVIPTKAHAGDAGFDLVAVDRHAVKNSEGKYLKVFYNTGIGIEIPPNHVGLIFPRSSVHKVSLRLSNAVGVIDSNYRGVIGFVFDIKHDIKAESYNIGDRIGQLIIIPYPEIEFEEVDELDDSERGTSGFGSSGR